MGTEPAAAETEQRALDERTGAGVRQDEPTISLVLHERGHARIVPLRAGLEIVVGRGEDCTIAFDDRGLSRRHAAFELGSDGRVLVRDLGSTNGTFVAGRRIDAIELAPGDEATLGAVVASLHVLRLGQARERELESHEAFRARLAAEVTRAQYFGRPLAVLMLRPLAQGAQPLRRWSIAVQQKLRPVDALAIYSDDALWALLPDAPLEEAVELARAVTVGLDLGLGCGLAVFPAAAASAEELLDLAREEARAASVEQPVRVASPEGARRVQAAGPADEGPVCESAAMRALYRTAARVARSALPVLLMAETGAGKEVLARFVHESSPRAAADMISVNCGAIAESLLESTLFGHEKGAFTGAVALHRGVFESAHQGTVFLDEVGELPLTAQAALLRVLEHGEVVRVGSTKPVPVDVRVVAATHRDLPALVAAGRFRQDLLYRLNAMTMTIPPLRERLDELPTLALRFLARANRANQTQRTGISPEAMSVLLSHDWPGNVRELKNVVERAAVIAEGDEVGVEDLPLSLTATRIAAAAKPAAGPPIEPAEGQDFRTRMEQLEAQVLLEALRAADWNQTRAAKALAMPLRTLVHKIKAHNLKRLGFGPGR